MEYVFIYKEIFSFDLQETLTLYLTSFANNSAGEHSWIIFVHALCKPILSNKRSYTHFSFIQTRIK